MSSKKETWKKVERRNVLPVYSVSDKGSVTKTDKKTGSEFLIKKWIVSTRHGKDCCVVLETEESFETVPVSELVACAFMGMRQGCLMSHKNNHVDNNGVGNLVLVHDGPEESPASAIKSGMKCVDINSGTEYSSLRDAAAKTGLPRSRVTKMVKSGEGESNGYAIRYKK